LVEARGWSRPESVDDLLDLDDRIGMLLELRIEPIAGRTFGVRRLNAVKS